ncbi:MAG: deoxyribodipyrimidine photo-lyase [Candidatus Chromulinivorax sp.]
MKSKIAILWLRNDLRMSDNLALYHAVQFGKVLPVFTIDNRVKKMGKNRLHFMYKALQSLDNNMDQTIAIFDQSFDQLLPSLIKKYQEYQIELFVNCVYEPEELALDEKLITLCKELGINCNLYQGNLLWNPSDIKNLMIRCIKYLHHFLSMDVLRQMLQESHYIFLIPLIM